MFCLVIGVCGLDVSLVVCLDLAYFLVVIGLFGFKTFGVVNVGAYFVGFADFGVGISRKFGCFGMYLCLYGVVGLRLS